MSKLITQLNKSFAKVSYKCNRFQNCRPICLSSNRFKNTENNDNNNNENQSNGNKSDDKTSIEKVKEQTEIDELKLGPNEGVYDPTTDPNIDSKLLQYKYPQYFTRRLKNLGLKRAVKIFKDDMSLLKEGRIHRRPDEQPTPFQVDIAIFGGGIIGASIAYFLKERAPNSFSCAVIERDPTVSCY